MHVLPTNNISACSLAFWDKISKFHLGQTENSSARCDGHSVRSIALSFASFYVGLPSEGKKPSWIDWTIEISPSTRWFLLCWFPQACHVFKWAIAQPFVLDNPRHHIDLSCICALTSACAFAAATVCSSARDRARAAAGPSTFWLCASQWVPLRSACWSY